ncbi:multidrug efflux system protein [Georgfuchsia toluolica]|uniref:Multidrug efflux system protein n=1 Tax=Georgfuchsia toluolica TaxID=424218 RepID=A0A916J151_9PROT|nr:DHA2 family efflux MFS transporter permease subunit [Georgfuchsia toluolica]CAG4882782.1 multidrug efflux system protein [Georgfuchsia toluolica]
MEVPQQPLEGSTLVLLTLALALASFMQLLDTSIANVSIPAIAGDLAASPNQGTWVITSFTVSNAIAMPLTGWLSRRFGEVRVFVFATALFTLASGLCGLAPNLGLLIAARVMQGAFAGPMIPLSQSLLISSYPPERKTFALSLWSMTVVVAPIMGPIMGGWITDNFSWPWIFYINLPVGLLAAFLTWQALRDRESAIVRQPIDTIGLMLLIVSVGALQIMLDKGNEMDWFESSEIVVLGLVALLGLIFFVVWELTEQHPVVDLHLFSGRNFFIGSLVFSLGYMAFFANIVILPLWLQTNMGYTATWAGLATAPIGLLPLFLSTLLARHMHRSDPRLWATVAFGVFGATAYWFSGFNTDIAFSNIVIPRFIQGIGILTFFVPLTTLTLAGLPPQLMASAAGLMAFTRFVAASIGVSLSIAYWEHRTAYHHSTLVENATPYSPVTADTLSAAQSVGFDATTGLTMIDRMAHQQAVMLATNDFFLVSAGIFVVLMFSVWFARAPKA